MPLLPAHVGNEGSPIVWKTSVKDLPERGAPSVVNQRVFRIRPKPPSLQLELSRLPMDYQLPSGSPLDYLPIGRELGEVVEVGEELPFLMKMMFCSTCNGSGNNPS